MTKTALCLYGQPREVYRIWPRINSNLVVPNNCDVFFHTWYNPMDLSMKKLCPGHENRRFHDNLNINLPKITNPKKYIIEQQKTFPEKPNWKITDKTFEACWPWASVYNKETFIKDRNFAHQSMWYSIAKSISLKEEYSIENNIKYDCVILSRFDVYPRHLNIGEYDMSILHSHGDPKPRGEVSDWFMFSSNSNMNIVSSLYNCLDFYMNNLLSQDKITVNEAFLREHLELYNIPVQINQNIKITF